MSKDEAPFLDLPNGMKPKDYRQQFNYASEDTKPKRPPNADKGVNKEAILNSVNAPR